MDKNALTYALKLLGRRDYGREELRKRLETRFATEIDPVVEWLEHKGYLDDRRFVEAFLDSHPQWGPVRLESELEQRGVSESIRQEVLDAHTWPSVKGLVRDRMIRMKCAPPLTKAAAARIARTLGRLGYDPGEIEEELERLL